MCYVGMVSQGVDSIKPNSSIICDTDNQAYFGLCRQSNACLFLVVLYFPDVDKKLISYFTFHYFDTPKCKKIEHFRISVQTNLLWTRTVRLKESLSPTSSTLNSVITTSVVSLSRKKIRFQLKMPRQKAFHNIYQIFWDLKK